MTTAIVLLVLTLLGLGLGLVLLVLGAAAVLFTVLEAMPWLLVLVGLWVLLRAQRGRRQPARARPAAPAGPPAGRAAPLGTPQAAARGPARRPGRELPSDLQLKVDQVRRKADRLLGYADRFPPFSHDLHLVQQTAAEYLPRTVAAYLARPGANDPLLAGAGQAARQELTDQLNLLDAKLDQIAQNLQQRDLDRLLANRHFLEARFRTEQDGLQAEAPEAPAPPAPPSSVQEDHPSSPSPAGRGAG
jgi:hypothetical protein